MIRAILLALAVSAVAAAPALAAPVELEGSIGFRDGRLTLGDLFEGAGPAASVVVASGLGASAVLDAGQVQAVAQANGLDWGNPAGFRRIIARAGEGGDGPRRAARAPAARRLRVLAYARDISSGEILQASDLVWSKEAVAPMDAPSDSEMVIGQAARRPLREGAAVARHDVAPAQVIKSGDIISIAYEADGILLKLQAKAMQAASTGEAFNAVNTSSKKVIQAVAIGPGEAVVGPRAEQIRAMAQSSDSRLYASLR